MKVIDALLAAKPINRSTAASVAEVLGMHMDPATGIVVGDCTTIIVEDDGTMRQVSLGQTLIICINASFMDYRRDALAALSNLLTCQPVSTPTTPT